MSDEIRFHLDEHVPRAIATALRRRGIDVSTSGDAGLIGADDEKQLEFCNQSGRALVTHDQDFLRLHSAGANHSGIIYCKQGSRGIGEMIRRLIVIHGSFTADEIAGEVLFL